tara:strand:+ start:483 stop:689 length:207 start_codon:yes stop_codon:yes gene_type:complete
MSAIKIEIVTKVYVCDIQLWNFKIFFYKMYLKNQTERIVGLWYLDCEILTKFIKDTLIIENHPALSQT